MPRCLILVTLLLVLFVYQIRSQSDYEDESEEIDNTESDPVYDDATTTKIIKIKQNPILFKDQFSHLKVYTSKNESLLNLNLFPKVNQIKSPSPFGYDPKKKIGGSNFYDLKNR